MSRATASPVRPPRDERDAELLSADALAFLAELHGRFGARRDALLAARRGRPAPSGFLAETRAICEDDDWQVPPPRPDYADRRVEITGPTDRKLVVNALNSGARGFMADFEDATTPRWDLLLDGQLNLTEAIAGTLVHEEPDGRRYELGERTATLLVRPRGWHLPEGNLLVGGEPIAGALFDVGLHLLRNARALLERGSAPYLYLPKLEHHDEAALWHDVLSWIEQALDLPHGAVRPTVLIETLPAAFQMEEILFALRERSYGLNAGRWDYIFSAIKSFRDRPEMVLPDRVDVKMTVPFMRAYTDLLVATCHRRGAFAMGGMAALVPSRGDEEATARAVEAVRADKRREAGDGFDGTWVAHPAVVVVAQEAFDAVLGERPNQIDRRRDDVTADAGALLDLPATPGAVTERGVRGACRVAYLYLSSWLSGRGAVAIDGLMEDAATAEICRAQLWQWIRHGTRLDDGRVVTHELVTALLDEEIARTGVDDSRARDLLELVALGDELPEFLTLVAYDGLGSAPPP
ncbi:malate synthase A [Conexibacter arvalis]|uniref:Malate synthase n=1 Tax=Conexibacter arvalis TaxID=912552 RepID=A0A840IDV1_9ACTN|nr:malate synthase A [Conexibacter arvalis]MBB4662208.1 malate synthase [Conexibacter arvalis]